MIISRLGETLIQEVVNLQEKVLRFCNQWDIQAGFTPNHRVWNRGLGAKSGVPGE
jgi:hypothetical protein